jgi:hypothetical protein
MQWQVGDVKISRIIEMEQSVLATLFYSDVSADAIKREVSNVT